MHSFVAVSTAPIRVPTCSDICQQAIGIQLAIDRTVLTYQIDGLAEPGWSSGYPILLIAGLARWWSLQRVPEPCRGLPDALRRLKSNCLLV